MASFPPHNPGGQAPLQTFAPTVPGPPGSRRSRIALWLWVVAAISSIAALGGAVAVYDGGERPTLRAMAASESMTEAQARAVADNTVRVWIRERNSGHLANLKALSCPDTHTGVLAREFAHVRNHDDLAANQVATTSNFTREGATWTLNVIFTDGGAMFTLRVRDAELRVCQIDSAPVP